MRHSADVARGRDIVTRWCALAEQRLKHLTELFETGRWRRYYNETEFLENMREANAAVEIWRELSRRGSDENSPLDILWLGRRAPSVSSKMLRDPVSWMQKQPMPLPDVTPKSEVSVVPQADRVLLTEAASEPEVEISVAAKELAVPALDFAALAARYPLLRNTL